ncbi:MAG TPA: GlsB/YeaQ/YmgE family stress response membrane protein [Euzebyales bacterium]|nr:GlsB/YeaQ/YmgE family stress response membrane protein [Euzebyales bacterium]
MLSLIGFIIIGLIAGYVARLVVPGPDPLGLVGTLILGVVGSFIGGFLWNLFAGGGELLATSGLIGSIIGAIIALLIYRAMKTRRA